MAKEKKEERAEQGDAEYLRKCIEIEPLAIQEEYVRLPADLAYWNARYADALRAFLHAKVDVDVAERELYLLIRRDFEDNGVKATEKMIDSKLVDSEEWRKRKRAVADTEAEKLRMYGVIDSLRAKREMLVSLGAHLRIEMQGDPVLREQSREFSGKMGFGGG